MNGVLKGYNKYKSKVCRMSPVAKASAALIIAKFFQQGLSFISGPIFTRIMPQAEYGVTNTFMSWQSVLYVIATLNMSSGVFNNGMVDYKEQRESFMASIMLLANTITIILSVVFFSTYRLIQPYLGGIPKHLIVLMFIYFMFMPAYNYWMGWQRFQYKYKALCLVMIISSVVITIVSIIGVCLTNDNNKAETKLLVTEIVPIILGVFFEIFLLIKAKCNIRLKYWKYALSFQVPLVPHYLSMYVLSSSDRIMITNMIGLNETAIYSVAYTVATVLLIIWNAIDASYAPWIYEKMNCQKRADIKKRANQIMTIFALLTILVSLFSPEVIRILAPNTYYNGIYVVPSVAASVFFTTIFSLFMRVELYMKSTKFSMIATCVAALINLLLNYYLIPVFGFYAAGFTTMISYAVLALAHWLNLCRLKVNDAYDGRFSVVLTIVVLLFSCGIMFVYNNLILRYLIIAILIITCFIKRKWIITVLKHSN